MIRIRRSQERGHVNHGWLDSYHTFSFGNYHDPKHTGFGSLRVINEDRVEAKQGFGTHPHRDMEIISYVISGGLQHRDSMGTGSIIRPGELQLMSAGTGVTHSEFNASSEEKVHFLQIWIIPKSKGTQPRYEQKAFPVTERTNRLRLLASEQGRDQSLTIGQDADLYGCVLEPQQTIQHPIVSGRRVWLQMVRGQAEIQGQTIQTGDGVAVTEETEVSIRAIESSEFLLFDLTA